jgi:hypothetical protein
MITLASTLIIIQIISGVVFTLRQIVFLINSSLDLIDRLK